ncbi:MAG: hypothetical protein H6709_23790 [Kofleriaceae bacterium]|nr:hypothetical protein [Kofleriaceae bacterium]MCB9575109.1 hypothetical protein [Kofleriaceae bacterium]
MDTAAFEDFTRRFQAGMTDPEQVIRLFVEAMLTVETDRDLAEQLFCVVIARNLLTAAPGTPSGHRLPRPDQTLNRLAASPAIARSLAGGTTAAAYQDADLAKVALDRAYSARTQGVDYPSPGRGKFFVACGGAATPRPLTLARNDAGGWKVVEWSSLTVGVARAGAGDF